MIRKIHKTKPTEILVNHVYIECITDSTIALTLVGVASQNGKTDEAVIPVHISKVFVDEDTVEHLIRTYSKLYDVVVEEGVPTLFCLSSLNNNHEDDGFNLEALDDLHPIKWEHNNNITNFLTYS